jgi:hypothetical protein
MHQTETICVDGKDVEVDCLMAPFVRWLNEFPSLRSKFSCEGGGKARPYVIIACDDDEDLRVVLRKIQPEAIGSVEKQLQELMLPVRRFDQYLFADCEVKMDTVSKWYVIRFRDRGNLVLFNRFMGY